MLDLQIINKVQEVEKQTGQSLPSLLSQVPLGNVLTAFKELQVSDLVEMVNSVPFDCLTTEVQELDRPYVEKLNEVLDYFKGLKQIVEGSNVNK